MASLRATLFARTQPIAQIRLRALPFDVLGLRMFDRCAQHFDLPFLPRRGLEELRQARRIVTIPLAEIDQHTSALFDLEDELLDPRRGMLAVTIQAHDLVARVELLTIEHFQARL